MKTLFFLLSAISLCHGGTIDARLYHSLPESIILELPPVIDMVKSNPALQALSGDAKVEALVDQLKGLSTAAQAPFIAKLDQLGAEYRQHWSSNIVLVKRPTPEIFQALSNIPGVWTLRRQFTAKLPPTTKGQHYAEGKLQGQAQWGVAKVRAPAAWSVTNGTGSVVGIIDTGVYMHSALQAGFSGAWADPVYNRPNPADGHGHGTHVAGTAVGRANGVGVAPGATWVGCRGLDNYGSGSEADLIACAEFMLTASPRPHVVSCSWGGGQGEVWFNSSVQAWREAGIIPVFAIGNEGSWCRSAGSPGDLAGVIGVGATTELWDSIASFSSRGPSRVGMRLKPELVAPGEDIMSADALQGGYVKMSGTSMATPHVAGAIALLLSANNHSLTYEQVLEALATTAFQGQLTNSDKNCGLPSPDQNFPNYAWGWGRIDVGAALGV